MSQGTVWAILVAGGSGERYGAHTSKLLEPLQDKPVIWHSFNALYSLEVIAGVVIVSHPLWEADYQSAITPQAGEKPIFWVHGGASRRASVWQGLMALPEEADIVLIHDAARPLVKADYVQAVLDPVRAGKALGASLGVPVPNTLKQISDNNTTLWVKATLNRAQIWQVHTPQVFQKATLVSAHQQVPQTLEINDDAELVERIAAGKNAVLMVADDPLNLKITKPADLQLAEALLSAAQSTAHSARR